MGAASGIRRLAEAGSARARMPTTRDGVPEAVLINTAGGIASGDLFETEIDVASGAHLIATTAAAEKIYRSEGETSAIHTSAMLAPGARLDWLPQETILFDRARFRRRLDVAMHASATALLFEATVFGRAAHDETVVEGAYEDRWRVRRDGRLVYADTLRLAGAISEILARPTVAAGMRAWATLLYVAPDAEARIEEARAHLEGAASECGASAWNGLLAIRWLAPDIATLRRDAARFMNSFRGRPLPRVWHL
jgi:urease accessory protein